MSAEPTKASITDEPPGRIPQIVEKERDALKRQGRLNSLHWIIIALGLLATFAAWQYSKKLISLRTEARFNVAADDIPELVRERLQKYELALLSGVSARKAMGGDFDLAGWNTFAANLDLENLYPGINGIGVIHAVASDELEGYLANQRLTRPDYFIHPAHGQDIYQPITYIYPVETNAEAVGLDMVHETNRHSSLNKARDTGTPQITGPIVLVQDEGRTPGFLFFSPTYADANPETEAERRATFSGAVYAPFIVSKLIDGTLGRDRRSTMIRISDGDQIIYDEISGQGEGFDFNSLGEKRVQMELYGREWNIDIRAGLNFRKDNSPHQSTYILAAGITIDLALLVLFIFLTRANRRGLRFADLATNALQREAEALKISNDELVVARKSAESVGEMKSAFLATMSHEVRTPLTAISGILMLLDRAKLPEDQHSLVQAGKLASEKLLKLLTDVLDISKLEANAVQLWEREVVLRPIIEEWGARSEGMVGKLGKDISVSTVVADDLPQTIIVDDIRLAQVMNNLMDNAVRFTDAGSITLSATVGDDTDGNPATCTFSITDTGKGIPQKDLSVVFERFRQVDGSITRTEGGSGLGLAISHDLVKLLGGDIRVSSEVGKGTTFKVTLPVQGTGQIEEM